MFAVPNAPRECEASRSRTLRHRWVVGISVCSRVPIVNLQNEPMIITGQLQTDVGRKVAVRATRRPSRQERCIGRHVTGTESAIGLRRSRLEQDVVMQNARVANDRRRMERMTHRRLHRDIGPSGGDRVYPLPSVTP